MADALNDNTEYDVDRRPDLQVVSSGAKVRYTCRWKGPSNPPTVIGQQGQGPRDGVRWYIMTAKPDWLGRTVFSRPIGFFFEETWSDDPGQYRVIAEIRNSTQGPKPTPSYRSRTQQIGDAGAMLSDWLNKLLKEGDGPSPDEAERESGARPLGEQ